MSYSAIVCRLTNVRPHPNADRLMLATVKGYQIVVGKGDSYEEGTLGVFFPCDGQLSDEFCKANDLYPRFDDQKKRVGGGFIDPKNRRVRSQKFRGEKSEGFWVPLRYFAYLATEDQPSFQLPEGAEFTEIDGRPICNKYMTKATLEHIASRKKKGARRETTMFKAHLETDQLRKHADEIEPGALVIATEKLHGTSGRYGHVKEDVEVTGWRAFLAKVAMFVSTGTWMTTVTQSVWKHVVGTRNVILGDEKDIGEKFRVEVLKKNGIWEGLKKGETFYFEIVGWQDSVSFGDGRGTLIMQPQDTTGLQDKEIQKKYGDRMVYSYGCLPGTCEMYVYRITQTNEDGYVVELPWCAVKERCRQLGVKTVPELVVFQNLEKERGGGYVLTIAGNHVDGPSTLDPKHIREGVCVRVEQGLELLVMKEKSFTFKVLEGIAKEDEAAVDLEEVS